MRSTASMPALHPIKVGRRSGVAMVTLFAAVPVTSAGLVPGWLIGETAVDINDARTIAGRYTGAVTDIPNLVVASDAAINSRRVRISRVNGATGQVWVAGNCAGNRPFPYERNSGTLIEPQSIGSINTFLLGPIP